MTMMKNKKILYLVAEDWSFCSHRLPMARAARDAGMDVIVATRVSNRKADIEREGFKVVSLNLRREGRNPFQDFASLLDIIKVYRQNRPDIVHHVAIKPILYGSIAARVVGIPSVVNAFTGLGYVFMGDSAAQRLLRFFIVPALRFLLAGKNTRMLVQNDDDRMKLHTMGIGKPERTMLIPGSGVDTEHFQPAPEPGGQVTATLVGRMLWDKGVGEFVEAARLLRQSGNDFRAVLVGTPDPANPKSIPEEKIRAWEAEGLVEWKGYQEDVRNVWAETHIAVLPSYREGMPKSLLEAAAMGRPLIASDVPGCRDLVKDGENGILVPAHDAQALADALGTLSTSAELRAKMGTRARQIIEQSFSAEVISRKIVECYQNILENSEP